MKFAQLLGLFAVILASTLPSSQAWLHKEVFRKEADVETTTVTVDEEAGEHTFEGFPDLCNSYWQLDRALRKCINASIPRYPNSFAARKLLADMCADKDYIKACMSEEVEGCETNYDTIAGMVDTALDYCDGYDVPDAVDSFLSAENVTVGRYCMRAVFDFENMTSQQCNYSTAPDCRSDDETLAGEAEHSDSIYTWYVNCMITTDLTEVPDDSCGDVTRGQAYGILISTLPLFTGLGVNHYPKFEKFLLAYELGYF